jgi:ABC transporter transmembrane region
MSSCHYSTRRDYSLHRYSVNLVAARKKGVQKSIINGAGIGMTTFVIFCSYCLGFWYGGKLVIDKEMSLGSMIVVSYKYILSTDLGALGSTNWMGGSAAPLFFPQPSTASHQPDWLPE